MRINKTHRTFLLSFLLIFSLCISSFALTLDEEAAANSAAWWEAKANGDTENSENLYYLRV